jgi:hypothetical protein
LLWNGSIFNRVCNTDFLGVLEKVFCLLLLFLAEEYLLSHLMGPVSVPLNGTELPRQVEWGPRIHCLCQRMINFLHDPFF